MPVFIYHPTNEVGKKLKDAFEEDGFEYKARPHLEAIIKDKLQKVGIPINQGFYCHLGSMSSHSLHKTIDEHCKVDPEDHFFKQILNHFKAKRPWAYVKMMNAPTMTGVIGFCNSDPTTPFLMTTAQMAQEGVIDTSFVPR